jgi:hypothetical protein
VKLPARVEAIAITSHAVSWSFSASTNGFSIDTAGTLLTRLDSTADPLHYLALIETKPDAPRGKLYIDPLLPAWLPDLTRLDLRLGSHRFDIRFWREGEETKFEMLRGDPKAIERITADRCFDRMRAWAEPA